jgi:hypothetical protein
METRKGVKMAADSADETGTDEFVELKGQRQAWTADELRTRIRRDFANPEFQHSMIVGMVERFEKVLKEDYTG